MIHTGSHDLSAGGASRKDVKEQSMVTKDDLPVASFSHY